jgi:uncharacterized membrane protein YcaP (DUF421 family)
MEWFVSLFAQTTHLSILQMVIRALLVFIAALLMLRLAGKRTFGKRSAIDNVIMIMLGAILSRAVVGASPFVPVILSSLVIVLFHRLLVFISIYNRQIGMLVKGKKESLYKSGSWNEVKMRRCMMSKEDVMEGVRIQINSESFSTIQEIFIERNGEISIVRSSAP